MTSLWGNDNGGGGSGSNGHRVIVTYSYSQSVAGNYTDVAWSYGVDYGDPNYWNNITNRSVAWSVSVGSSISGVAGFGTGTSSAPFINTSDPGYGGQIHYFWTGTARIFHNSNGQGTIHLAASMNFNSNSYTSSISTDIALPDIVQAPTAPGTPTGTRVNDGQINLSWTNNSATHREYASQSVQRSVDGGSYSTIISGLAAGATSYSDTTTSATHKYQYKIVATNAAGSATSGASTAVYTTPGVPTIGTATKQPNNDVELSWTNNAGYGGDTSYGTDIYESVDGGAFTYTASVSGGLTTWTDVAPNTSQTHAYKVLHTKGALFSALSSASNTVTLLSTASAPTGLSPSGVAKDAADAITLSWTHNPTDGTPQSARQVQAKVNAGAYADLVNDASGTSSYTVSAATWTNGDTITWKVRTAGQNGTLSAYSAESTITLSAKPTVTINEPTATYDSSSLAIAWGYFQAQASAQASWEARLYDDNDALIESISGTTEVVGAFTHTVEDGASYTLKMTVTSAAGLTSTEDSQAFTVVYSLPADIAIAGVFDSAAGFTVLTLTGEAASSGYSGLVTDGTDSADFANTPDAAALDITGDIDIRIDVEMTDWTPAATTALVAKWESGSNNRSWEVVLTTAGMIRFRLSTDGTSGTIVEATSSVAPTPVNNRLSLRIDRNSGVVTFQTSTGTDLTGASWVTLGTTQAAAGTMFASTATVKVSADGGNSPLAGTVYSVEIRNSADTVVANPRFATEAAETTTFDDDAGLTWTLAGDAAIETIVPATEEIATVDVQRQIDGGEWVTVLTGVVLDAVTRTAVVSDTVPGTVATNTYRAIAYSALPSSVISATDDVVTSETTWGYLSGGDSFADVARFRATPTFAASTSRAKALYHFAGRPKPVQLAGEALTATLSVSGKLSSGSGTPADFEALGQAEGVVCWRGPDGRRVFASIAKMDVGVTRVNALTTVAFTLTEVDFTEGDQ